MILAGDDKHLGYDYCGMAKPQEKPEAWSSHLSPLFSGGVRSLTLRLR